MVVKIISLEDKDEELDDYCDMKLSIKLNEVPEILEKDMDILFHHNQFIYLRDSKLVQNFCILTQNYRVITKTI